MARRKLDYYPTPVSMTVALLNLVPNIKGRIIEPASGQGHITAALVMPDSYIYTNDIDPRTPAMYHGDARLSWAKIWGIDADWVVTNPPFSDAYEILENAWNYAGIGVAMLLRLTFLEPTGGRKEWLQEHQKYMSDLIIFGSPRPSFTGKGTDSVTTAWMVWQRKHNGPTNITYITDWRKEQ